MTRRGTIQDLPDGLYYLKTLPDGSQNMISVKKHAWWFGGALPDVERVAGLNRRLPDDEDQPGRDPRFDRPNNQSAHEDGGYGDR
jgi:hypothetical protein